MALLTATRPTAAGVVYTAAAVSASDTIAAADLVNGAFLIVINGGGSPDTVTVADPGFSPAGNAGTALTNSVTNATTEVMTISPASVNPSTGLATITHSFITSVTYVLIPK